MSEIRRLSEPAPGLGDMTYPAYRHLLALERTSRHPDQGDDEPIDPLALVAEEEGLDGPVGLALGELPVPVDEEDDRSPELLSVFVRKDRRGRGVATRLVEATERAVRDSGGERLRAVYTAGKPGTLRMERIFARRGWEDPEPRTLSVQFTPEAGLAAPVFEPRRMKVISRGLEIVPWSSVTEEEIEELRRSHERDPWIEPNLAAWRFLSSGFDPSSVAGRWKGKIVGWVINHRVDPHTVRFTCSFIRTDLSRRGRILPLYRASLERLHAGCRLCVFVTPFSYPAMIEFIRRWIAPISERVVETRGVEVAL